MIFQTEQGSISLDINELIIAGWTGRNRVDVNHHIEELSKIGVKPPSEVPLFYQTSNNLLVQAEKITVLGSDTSGEVEPLILQHNGKYWLGLASDHTDRALEAHSVAYSKQICPKPVANYLWSFEEVSEHFDKIVIRSKIDNGNEWVLYQEGTLESILPLKHLLSSANLSDNSAMLCGTLSAKGGVRPSNKFLMEIVDPILNRSIECSYAIKTIPVVA